MEILDNENDKVSQVFFISFNWSFIDQTYLINYVNNHSLETETSDYSFAFSALMLLVGQQEGHSAVKKLSGGMLAWLSV